MTENNRNCIVQEESRSSSRSAKLFKGSRDGESRDETEL